MRSVEYLHYSGVTDLTHRLDFPSGPDQDSWLPIARILAERHSDELQDLLPLSANTIRRLHPAMTQCGKLQIKIWESLNDCYWVKFLGLSHGGQL